MTEIDMTFETRLEYVKRDSYEEGLEDGIEKGREEGREEERLNTEREKKRADAAEAEVERYKKLLAEAGIQTDE